MNTFRTFHVFSSHMVLQRNRDIVISGYGKPGEDFTATFAEHSVNGVIGSDGTWRATFPPKPAGGPWTFQATCGDQTIALDDILVGDVWFCSGQSNMEMPVYSPNPFWRTKNSEAELEDVDYPNLRLFNSIPARVMSPWKAVEDDPSTVGWQHCTRESVAPFSACGFFFGKKLQKDLDIPIGLISCSWGGTIIESWISPTMMALNSPPMSEQELQASVVDTYLKNIQGPGGKEIMRWLENFDNCAHVNDDVLQKDFDDSDWTEITPEPVQLPSPRRTAFRLAFELPENLIGKQLAVNLGTINDADATYFDGVKIGETTVTTHMYWSATRHYTIPADLATPGKHCMTIIADNHFGTGQLSTLRPTFTLANGDEVTVTPVVRTQDICVLPADFPMRPNVPSPAIKFNPTTPNFQSTLFNGMVYPWLRYKIKGAIWYQGCSNNGEYEYYQTHQMLIQDWRNQWNEPDMPFLIVQLAAFHAHSPDHRGDEKLIDQTPFSELPPYALTREIQAEIPKVMHNVATIPAFDCGDAFDIHPRDKQSLGYRLALKAESMLGWTNALADGPTYDGCRIEGNKIRIYFKNVGAGLKTTDGLPPTGFCISDRNETLVLADAEIDGATVLVSSPYVTFPQRVRYAFTGFCNVNLCNSENLPAMPFRTDACNYATMFR